jgi:protein-S-isoprenylcysteine O-methyltransferase Ste14
MKVRKLIKNITQFYLTLAIPLLYFIILGIVAATPNTFPQFLLPVIYYLSLPISRYLSLLMAGSGVFLWIGSYFYLGREFGVLPRKPKKIIKSGFYKYFKHPMYVGIFLAFTGLSLANLSFPGFLANLLILTPINYLRAKKESGMVE